ncbi:MAG: hypothetical protein ACI9VN_003007, partial [Patescibacteria group bacterium]
QIGVRLLRVFVPIVGLWRSQPYICPGPLPVEEKKYFLQKKRRKNNQCK